MEAEKGFGERYRAWIGLCTPDPLQVKRIWQEILRSMPPFPEAQASGKTPGEDGIQ